MVGLDPRSMRLVKDLLRRKSREGMTVFMSTHSLAVAEEISDRIGIVESGELRFLGTLAELRSQLAQEHTSLEDLYLEINVAPAICTAAESTAGAFRRRETQYGRSDSGRFGC